MRQPLIDKNLNEFDENGMQVRFAICPFGASETRTERIARWEKLGTINPNCKSCKVFYESPTLNAFAPKHTASRMCRSGRRPHCTCNACF